MNKLKMSTVLDEADQNLQIKHKYLLGWSDEAKSANGYCAIGLLMCKSNSVDAGGEIHSETATIREKFRVTAKQLELAYKCDECNPNAYDAYAGSLIGMIIHLNDVHGQTYKQIAKYLKGLKL